MRRGWLTRTQRHRALGNQVTSRDLDRALATLVEQGKMRCSQQAAPLGRPAHVYELTGVAPAGDRNST